MYPRVGEVDEDSAQRIAAAIAGTSSLDEAAAALLIPSAVLKAAMSDSRVQRACSRFRAQSVSLSVALTQTMALAIQATNQLLTDPSVSHELRFKVVEWVFDHHGQLLAPEQSEEVQTRRMEDVRAKVISILDRQKKAAEG